MSLNVRVLRCAPADVFAVIADGWLFPSWVVGASRMREVDDAWPAVGSELHHSFGAWPAVIDDTTVSIEWDPPRRAVMKARGWPLGEALITLDAKPRGDDTVVRIQEEAVAGPGRLIPTPLLDVGLHVRNAETLHRLAYLAEGRVHRAERSTAEQEIVEGGE
ncbi:SRPBCC family protein [Microbacterium sp. P07]|uniref:SRPBCC family protein n=1 Tax=Microbacterium sp. P07 TaxID=3366952 RepID=UPI0037477BA8